MIPRDAINRGGRPKGSRNKVQLAGETLARQILEDVDAPGILRKLIEEADPRVRLDALKFVYEQGYGKARQRLELSGGDGPPVRILKFADERTDDHPASAPSGTAGGEGSPGPVQGGGLRTEVG